ncbi:MAG: hypothetical protein D6808_01725 [Candidatus Dadabacteria bacterium]|nr:MAG: hypothetical protein D6808_01725 [Candidatus Dadabacteria bacterium]
MRWHYFKIALLSLCLFAAGLASVFYLSSFLLLFRYQFILYHPHKATLGEDVLRLIGVIIDSAYYTKNLVARAIDKEPLGESSLPAIHIKADKSSIEEMISSLPESAKSQYYPAEINLGSGWHKAKYRFRGRNFWHWMKEKPSLRIKLKKGDPWDLQYKFNLINPEDKPMIANYLGDKIAEELGVLTNITRYMRVFFNGKYKGLYHWVTVEDKGLLYARRRVQGPIFVGDELKDKWEANQFELHGDTTILSEFNPMSVMINAINTKDHFKATKRLWKILDMRKLAAWQAAMNIGGGIHTNFFHNHIYYYDPAIGRLEPIVSDMNGYGLLTTLPPARFGDRPKVLYDIPLNELLQPLTDKAFRDPRFCHLRNKILYKAISGKASSSAQIKELTTLFNSIDGSVFADPNKGALEDLFTGYFRVPYSNTKYKEAKKGLFTWIKNREQFLLSKLSNTKVRIRIAKNGDRTEGFTVAVSGHSAALFDLSSLRSIEGIYRGKKVKLKSSELLYPGLREDMKFRFEPTYYDRNPKYYLMPDVQYYHFKIPPTPINRVKEKLEKAFYNGVTHSEITPQIFLAKSLDIQEENTAQIHIWRLRTENPNYNISLGPGKVVLRSDIYVPEGGSLKISPGTVINAASGVSILVEGRLHANGTAEKPIIFSPFKSSEGWGGLALRGEGAKGSSLSHVTFIGGDGFRKDRVKYEGVLSLHGASKVKVRNVVFKGRGKAQFKLSQYYGSTDSKGLKASNCSKACLKITYGRLSASSVALRNASEAAIASIGSEIDISSFAISQSEIGVILKEMSEFNGAEGLIETSNTGIVALDGSRGKVSRVKFLNNDRAVATKRQNKRFSRKVTLSIEFPTWQGNKIDIAASKETEILVHGEKPRMVTGKSHVIHR